MLCSVIQNQKFLTVKMLCYVVSIVSCFLINSTLLQSYFIHDYVIYKYVIIREGAGYPSKRPHRGVNSLG